MQIWIVKVAMAALLILASLTGAISAQYAESTPGAESVAPGTTLSAQPSSAEPSRVSVIDEMADAEQTLDSPASIVISPGDLIAASVCVAMIGCCVLGFVLLRFRLLGHPRSSWTTAVRRTLSVASPVAPLTSPLTPSLIVLSVSRT